MFGYYALPTDDHAQNASGVTASDEDTGYPAENLITDIAANPAKLDDTDGYWDLTFGAPIAVIGYALIYTNFDSGLPYSLIGGGGAFTHAATAPAPWEDGWTPSPWAFFDSVETHATWRLSIDAANSINPQVGRLLLLGAIRDLGNDVRWGVNEGEQHRLVRNETALGVKLDFELGGKERSFAGEFALTDALTNTLQTLRRSARGMYRPWLLLPDQAVNDAWFVQFDDDWSRTRETIGQNIIPFRVREQARGLPWP